MHISNFNSMRCSLLSLVLAGVTLTCPAAEAADFPSSLGSVALGQPAPKTARQEVVYGVKGDLAAKANRQGIAVSIRLSCECEMSKEAGDPQPVPVCDDELGKAVAQVRAALGAPGKESSTGTEVVWSSPSARLRAGQTRTEDGRYVFIELEAMSSLKDQAKELATFHTFVGQLRAALAANQRDALFACFKTPFVDSFQKTYDAKKAVSFRNRGEFERVYDRLFSAQARKAIMTGSATCSQDAKTCEIDYAYSHFVVAKRGVGWKILEIEYEE